MVNKGEQNMTPDKTMDMLNEITDELFDGVIDRGTRYDWMGVRGQPGVYGYPLKIASSICTCEAEIDKGNVPIRELTRVKLIGAHQDIIDLCGDVISKLEGKGRG